MRAAFSGGLGAEMKSKAAGWAHETPSISSLPEHVAVHHALASMRKKRSTPRPRTDKKD